LNVIGCDEFMCGNGIVEPGEECDGDNVAAASCVALGFSAGAVTCNAQCKANVTACCNDFCAAANTSACVGDSVESCVMQPNGCLGLEITNCDLTDDVCDDSNGTATCQCVDRCASAGIGHCSGSVAETCTMQADGCLAWTTNEDCGATGEACTVAPQGATCVAAASGESCTDPYPITDGQNIIAWSATNADYLTSQPSCNTSTLSGPDVVLSFTATVDGIVTYSLAKPSGTRHVAVVSNAQCGTGE
jgi:hypothetical protein